MKSKLVFKRSLVKRFVTLTRLFLVCFVIGSTLLLATQNFLNNSYITKRDELKAKQKIAVEVNDYFNQTLFDIRGYIAYDNPTLRDNALAQEPKIKSRVIKLTKHATTKQDRQLLATIHDFTQYYFNDTLPKVIHEYETGNKEEVVNIANNQGTARVIQFRLFMNTYLHDIDQDSENLYQKLIRIKTYIQIGFVLFIFFILLLLLRIIRLMLKQVGQPLTQLTFAANDIADGKDAVIPTYMNRDDEIGALSYAFQKMVEKVQENEQSLIARNKELDSLVKIKSELVNTVSHELRTPLASILGFSELMLHRELKPERKEKYLTTIFNEAKRLTALINDFLDLQRLESGKQSYEKRYIEMVPLLEKVIEVQQMTTRHHDITLEAFVAHPVILGDQTKIIQVFTNLINNAIKYSPDGGNIKIQVFKSDRKLKIAVSDNGLGIPKDSIDKLFTKFYRVDNSDRRKIGGTGLGLAIAQEIVIAHGGEITVQSQLGKGSIFIVVFPDFKTRRSSSNLQ